ncbi:MAG: DUF5666 domain-containing protein [Candidatus Paceibacterota bacterium]
MNKTKKIIVGILIIIALAFYGGFKYGQTNSAISSGQNNPFPSSGASGFARRNGGGGGGLIRGEIVKKDAQSLTIALPNSGSQIIWYATSTEIQKTTKGIADDLVVGQTVMINGTTNSDGSLTAQSIQLR